VEHPYICWRCGESLAKLSLPFGRADQCPACSNHLHVCRMCSFYDPAVAEACREDDAEEVKEKEKPNFCDYFKPSADVWNAAASAEETKARNELDALFGEASAADSGGSSGRDSDAEAGLPDDDPQAAARKLFEES